ncbi:unnamed protein product [Caenorhabditis angaria]|uniref:Uncharacterized protein n=1 Tax=Caenorhabditis angaria TaxID=860376 RepID=A0A9P1J1F9_9PELO|nr:unnamed protein product [Caenorhabditis angaria]
MHRKLVFLFAFLMISYHFVGAEPGSGKKPPPPPTDPTDDNDYLTTKNKAPPKKETDPYDTFTTPDWD